jgi:glyoxylase-like metal-dependent hydrolase (beta-lactamase superfamily II)
MKHGNFELSILRECKFRLDGGAMYGVVPKTLWAKQAQADDLNRVLLACNLLLIDTGTAKVLVETGMGSRWPQKEAERYDLHTLGTADQLLDQVGLTVDDIDFVIISHLHFDHAGGATIERDGKIIPTFPNAKYIAQQGEFDFSFKANARAKASYRKDDYVPLQEHGQLVLVDGDHEVTPGVWVKVTGGHTSHHQVVYWESAGQKGVYFADIIPTKSHVTPPWVMGYDHFPLASCDIKSEWLSKAAAENWLVVFDHEPGIPWGYVSLSDKGKFDFATLDASSLEFASGKGRALASLV